MEPRRPGWRERFQALSGLASGALVLLGVLVFLAVIGLLAWLLYLAYFGR